MHPLYTSHLVAEHIAGLHDDAARSRLVAQLRDGGVPAVRPRRARLRWRARRPRPAIT
jgi:hypothetical protein